MIRTGLLSIIRSLVLYTQQWALVIQVMLIVCSAIGICRRGYASEIRMKHPDLASRQHNLCDKYPLLFIQYYTPDDGQ